MRNITGDITNCILRKKENRVYYFDENGIYKSILIEEIEENDKKNTFDFIYLDINIVTQWPTSKKEYIQKNMSTIKKKAINKIKESGEFKKYGIPVNFLRITKCSLNNDVIELIFELKEI